MQDKLTEIEIVKIEAFCKDTAMFEAVKKVLFHAIYDAGVVKKGEKLTQTNGAFNLIANAYSEARVVSNEELGAELRAKYEGVHTVLDGFAQLQSIKKKVVVEELIENIAE